MTHVPPDPRPVAPPAPAKKGLSGCAIAGIGCGVALLLLAIALVAGVWYVATAWRGWAASGGAAAVTQVVRDSQLPDDQKQRIIARVEQVRDDYQAGHITDEQIVAVIQRLSETPLLHLGAVVMLEQQYVAGNPGLSDEERAAGRLALERFARGVYTGDLSQDAIGEVTAPITVTSAQGEPQLKENPTPDEVREVLRLAGEKADAAGVPQERWEVNIADEIDRAVDEALASPEADATPVESP